MYIKLNKLYTNIEYLVLKRRQGLTEYMEKLGTVVFDGRLYNLDNMSIEELEKLLNAIESRKSNVMNKIEEFVEAGETNG